MKVEIVGAGPAGLYLAILLQEARPRRRRPRPRAERARRDVRLRRRLQRGDARGAARRGSGDAPRDHGHVRALGPNRHPLPGARALVARPLVLGDRAQAAARDPAGALPRARRRRSSSASRWRSFRTPTSSSAPTARTASSGGSATSARRCGPRASKYVWFGTDHVFDAFTFAFRETEHGLFNAHAYPYDERMSTFIVECPEAVWRAAGLDEMDEQESLAFCEQLFANELRGRELFSNRSLWLDFPKVTNRTWHVGNVVILGDAAHTAHFSIGSGTKLAMEDSISLAAALARRRWDLDAAFVDYELEREPVRRAHAGRGERERRLLRPDRELLAPRADPVRVQPDHAGRAHHARDARRPRPAVHARARRLARRASRLAAAGLLAVRDARRAVREPVRARRERGRGQPGGAHLARGRSPVPRARSCSA